MAMTRAGAPRTPPRPSEDERTRVVAAAAARVDDLRDVVAAEVGRVLPSGGGAIRVGVTSLAPRDEAARAARWVARLAAQRGSAATLVGPSMAAAAWLARARRTETESTGDGSSATVGVSRLDLSPVIAAVDQPYAVGIWLPLEARIARLRRSATTEPDRQLIDAAVAARPVATVLIGLIDGMAIAVVGTDLLAAEVVGRALRSAAQPVGDLGLSPWQAPVVQRGIELEAGVAHPDLIDLESVWLGDPRDRGHDRLHRIVETASGRAGIGRAASDSSSSR